MKLLSVLLSRALFSFYLNCSHSIYTLFQQNTCKLKFKYEYEPNQHISSGC